MQQTRVQNVHAKISKFPLTLAVFVGEQNVQTLKLKMERVVSERALSPVCASCVLAAANQAERRRSDFRLQSQRREEIKEQLNSATALGPQPNQGFQELLKLLSGLASFPVRPAFPPSTRLSAPAAR